MPIWKGTGPEPILAKLNNDQAAFGFETLCDLPDLERLEEGIAFASRYTTLS